MNNVAIKKSVTRATIDDKTRIVEIGVTVPTTYPYAVGVILGRYTQEVLCEKIGSKLPELARALKFVLENSQMVPQGFGNTYDQNAYMSSLIGSMDTSFFVSIDKAIDELMESVESATQNEDFSGFNFMKKPVDEGHWFFGVNVFYKDTTKNSDLGIAEISGTRVGLGNVENFSTNGGFL
jgi:hypothetical protein